MCYRRPILRATAVNALALGKDMPFERVETCLPEGAVVLEPRRGLTQRPRLQVAVVLPAQHFAPDQAGVFEDLDVL